MIKNLQGQILLTSAFMLICHNAHANPFSPQRKFPIRLNGSDLQSRIVLDLSLQPKSLAFGLGSNVSTRHDQLRSYLDRAGLHSNVKIVESSESLKRALNLHQSRFQSAVPSDIEFFVHDKPICGAVIRALEEDNGNLAVVGSMPQVFQTNFTSDLDWPDAASSAESAITSVAAHLSLDPRQAIVTKVSRCYYNSQGYLDPSWDFILRFGEYQFRVFADENKIFEAQQRHLDAAVATVQAYDPNISSGTLKQLSISVNGDGYLTNEFFTTSVYTGASRVSSGSNSFTYTGANTASSEASTFAYLNQHYDFMAGKGYSWKGPKPLTVNVYATIRSTVNNALYTPFDGSSGPNIYVGEGDGLVLKNLSFDTDVVSHEFGHHIVYSSITEIGGESLVLHEGLADFLSFSRTGDACLGESICPTSSTMSSCRATNYRCLRTAENTLVYKDATYQAYGSAAHQQGQLVSGFLWDLRKDGVIAGDTLTEYVLEAINYLPSNATIKNLVAAIYYVDEKHGQTYRDGITTVATKRGLDPTTLGIDLNDLSNTVSANNSSQASESKSSSKKGFMGCGTITGSNLATKSSSAVFYVVFLLLPGFVVGLRRKVQK